MTVTDTRGAARDTRWLALAVIAVAQLMVALDATIVNIALPTAQHALHLADADRQWVVTAYTSALAGLLLLGGRIADRIGRRRAFLIGLAGFAVASGIAGLATGLPTLIAGRALQGAFAALLSPTALSLIAVTFTDGRERARAFGLFGAVASSGAAVGLLLGGILTTYAGWRWCLFVNVGVALAAAVAGRRVLPRDTGHPEARVDVPSGLLVTAGLATAVHGFAEAAAGGWARPGVLAPLAVAAALIGWFAVRQGRLRQPLLPLWIVTHRARAGAYLTAAVAIIASFGLFLMLTYHFQAVLGWSPIRAGLAFLPMSAAISVSAYGLGSRLLPVVAPQALIVPGMLVAAGGVGLLATLTATSGYLTVIAPAEVLLGLGMGLVVTPAISVATSGVEPRHAGVAAATASTAMQVGGSIGTAVLNSVAVATTAGYAGSGPDALVHGFAAANATSTVILVVAAAVAAALIRLPRPTHARPVEEKES